MLCVLQDKHCIMTTHSQAPQLLFKMRVSSKTASVRQRQEYGSQYS